MTGSPSDQPAPEQFGPVRHDVTLLETHRPRIAPRVSSIFASGSSATRAKRPLGLQRHGALLPRHRIHTLLADTSRRPPPRGRARSHDAAHAASSARSVAMTEPAGQVPASNPGRAAKPESRNPVVVWSFPQFGPAYVKYRSWLEDAGSPPDTRRCAGTHGTGERTSCDVDGQRPRYSGEQGLRPWRRVPRER